MAIYQTNHPPPRLERLLRALLDGTDLESLPGDFAELFSRIQRDRGHTRAVLWYALQIARFLPGSLSHQFKGTAAMIKNHFLIALRHLRRHPGFSLINIAGLAVGIACFLLIGLWVRDELSFDRYHEHADHTHWVVFRKPGESYFSTYASGPLGPALLAEYREITSFSRRFGPISSPLRFSDLSCSGLVMGVDPGFFDIFSFDFLEGTPTGALINRDSIVLTESTARRYFGRKNPLGLTMNFEWWGRWHDFTVTAVISDPPGNTHLEFDYLLPIDFVTRSGMSITDWGAVFVHTYVRLREDVDPAALSARIADIMRRNNPAYEADAELFPIRNIHLYYSSMGSRAVTYVGLFSLIGLLILAMACFNFINLSTARSAKRAHEVGMRKVIGARRGQLVRQFLGESMLLTLFALGASLGLVLLALPSFNALTGKALALRPDGGLLLQLAAVVLLVGVVAGTYPALTLSAFQPSRVLGKASAFHNRNPLFRKLLVVVQFAVSILLITCSLVVLRQSEFLRTRDMGIHTAHVLNMELRGGIRSNYRAIREELLKNPHVEAVCTTNGSINKRFATNEAEWEGKPSGDKQTLMIHAVDYDYADLFSIEMAHGRFFSREFATDAMEGIVLNETAVRRLGWRNPVGKWFRCPIPYQPDRPRGRVIGVVKDYNFRSLHEPIEPLILAIAPGWITDLYIRLDGNDLSAAVSSVGKIMAQYAPDYPFEFRFLDEEIENLYQAETRMGTLVRTGSGLAVLIACLGLFGLASFMAEQRTKEIGIRRVLGSSVEEIVLLFSKNFLIWVAAANLIAWPVAWWAMSRWLENFAFRTPLTPWPFLLSGAAALLLAVLTVSWQSIRAATADPVRSLRGVRHL